MRWAGQRVDDQEARQQPLAMPGLLRSVRTPEFAGVTFHEVAAKSVLNRVPGSSPMPFRWTVNPYRGCSHACTYCLHGDTPILMADGRTRAIRDLRVGDKIYGTVRDGCYRRYAVTQVLAHWSTVKTAYRITLEDGTRLITSGEHRFLTERGWKHVTGRMNGNQRRPYLTTGNSLLGTGRFAAALEKSADYQRGYLCGMIRGDAHLGSYVYNRPGRGIGAVHRFRLALSDNEALLRTRRYLTAFDITTDEFGFQAASGVRRALSAIRTSKRGAVAAIEAIIAWPDDPSDGWCGGFLAGIFDAEGSCSRGILRIANTNKEIIAYTVLSLERLGFEFRIEDGGRDNRLTYIRLLGGLCERMRFFHTVDPAITRKSAIAGSAIKTDAALGVRSIKALGVELTMFDITTATGDFIADGVVSHNCFARNTHTYLELDAGHDFDNQVVVKVNAAEVLRRELASRRWSREHVAMGTNTDPYQRAEGRYRLMPGIIAALAGSGTPLSILTKGTLLARDLPELAAAARDVPVGLGVSLALIDRSLQQSLEPGTPSPQARLGLVRRIREAGLRCGVFVAPVLPGLTDSTEQLDVLLAEIADAGASGVTVVSLHLRPGTREWFLAWLAREHPRLLPRYKRLYARGAYADRGYRRQLAARVGALLRRHGLGSGSGREAAGIPGDEEGSWPVGSLPGASPDRPSLPAPAEQLTLL